MYFILQIKEGLRSAYLLLYPFLTYNTYKKLKSFYSSFSVEYLIGKNIMKLSLRENRIINIFKNKIEEKFPEEKIKILVFGSKARGDASEDSDIDLIVITKSAGRNLTREIRFIGYDLEIEFNIILSIQVLSEDYINYLRALPTQFIQNVDRDAIAI